MARVPRGRVLAVAGARSRGEAIVIDGLEELKANLETMVPKEATGIMRKAVVDVANLIRDDIRAAIPTHVRHYRTAIATYRPRVGRGQVAADVVAKRTPPRAFYLHNIVEFGTNNRYNKAGAFRGSTAAHPFKEPIVERWRQRVPEELQKALSQQLAAYWERRRTGT